MLDVSTMHFIPTNCHSIDQLLGGGIPRGKITLVYGAYNTGKTSFMLQCSVACARKRFKTLYIDSDDTFSTTRLSQIAFNDLNSVSPKIILFKLKTFQEQGILFEKLERYMSNTVALIAIDTITSLYRISLKGPEETFALNRELNRQLAILTEIAKKYDVALLLTSQVHSIMNEERSLGRIEPVATRVLNFWSQNVLYLTTTEKHPVRRMTLEKHLGKKVKGISCSYVLTLTGISTDIEQ